MATTHPANITVPIMAPAPPTPPYDEEFENAAMKSAISTSSPQRPTNPSASTDPVVPTERPISLSDSRRQHPLPSTQILLTEPGGSIYGGPGPSQERLIAEGQELIEKHGFTSAKELEDFIARQIEEDKAEAVKRALKRLEAIERNALIDEEISELEMNHQMEKRAMEKRTKG
jgi:hypothetical protein